VRQLFSLNNELKSAQNPLKAKFFAKQKSRDPFEQYITETTIQDIDPLRYWESKKTLTPELAQMGFDYCSAPGIVLFPLVYNTFDQ
jgi:hypothetical protein